MTGYVHGYRPREGQRLDDRKIVALREGRRQKRTGTSHEPRKLGILQIVNLDDQTRRGFGAVEVIDNGLVLPAAPANQNEPWSGITELFGQLAP